MNEANDAPRKVRDAYDELAVELEEQGYDASSTHTYSGRGMHGRLCCGITTDAGGVEVGMTWARIVGDRNFDEETIRKYSPGCTDSMGMDKIYYVG